MNVAWGDLIPEGQFGVVAGQAGHHHLVLLDCRDCGPVWSATTSTALTKIIDQAEGHYLQHHNHPEGPPWPPSRNSATGKA